LRSQVMVPVLVFPFITTLPLPTPCGITSLAPFRKLLAVAVFLALRVVVPVQSLAGCEQSKMRVDGSQRADVQTERPAYLPEIPVLGNVAALPPPRRLSPVRMTSPEMRVPLPKRMAPTCSC
jgi:hypothetical protein